MQASLLGGGFALSSFNPVDNNNDLSSIIVAPSTNEYYDMRRDSLMGYIASTSECLGFVISPTMESPNLNSIEDLQNSNNSEDDLYFYHTDHLGSSSWITDASGSANQHLQYLPYGEDYIYQRNNEWDVPYTFSGKEKDVETGYSYFGARYYDSDLSIWLSVDPLADKYPSMSPFMYTAGNPVMLVDPDGMRIGKGIDVFNKFYNVVENYISGFDRKILDKSLKQGDALLSGNNKKFDRLTKRINKLESKRDAYIEVRDELDELSNSEQVYNINLFSGIVTDGNGGSTTYNPNDGSININIKGDFDSAILSHELKHAYQFETGRLSYFKESGQPGTLYDLSDEFEAFSRMTLFGGQKIDENSISVRYGNLASRYFKPLSIYDSSNGVSILSTLNSTNNDQSKRKHHQVFRVPIYFN